MAILLALDTVFEQCSVAILNNHELIGETTILGNRGQTETILPIIDNLLSQHQMTLDDVDVLAFNRGPGAFSGIRINTAVVQALSFALDVPCVGVSSLRALAQKAFFDEGLGAVCAVLDARMNEVYCGYFEVGKDTMQLIGDELLVPYHSVSDYYDNDCMVVGKDARLAVIPELANQLCWEINNPTASDIGKIAYFDYLANGGVAAQNALPVYLRNHAWKTLAEQGKSK